MHAVIFSEGPAGRLYGYVAPTKTQITDVIKFFDEKYPEWFWRRLDDEGNFCESKNEESVKEIVFAPSTFTPIWK